MVFLNQRPQSRLLKGQGNSCETCDRVLQEPYRYCSVRCKVDDKDVADGDTINVYVDTKNAREAVNVPTSVQEAMIQRREACARRDYKTTDALNKQITNAGYRFVFLLFRKYILPYSCLECIYHYIHYDVSLGCIFIML